MNHVTTHTHTHTHTHIYIYIQYTPDITTATYLGSAKDNKTNVTHMSSRNKVTPASVQIPHSVSSSWKYLQIWTRVLVIDRNPSFPSDIPLTSGNVSAVSLSTVFINLPLVHSPDSSPFVSVNAPYCWLATRVLWCSVWSVRSTLFFFHIMPGLWTNTFFPPAHTKQIASKYWHNCLDVDFNFQKFLSEITCT